MNRPECAPHGGGAPYVGGHGLGKDLDALGASLKVVNGCGGGNPQIPWCLDGKLPRCSPGGP